MFIENALEMCDRIMRPQPEANPNAPSVTNLPAGPTALLVDDEPLLLEVLKEILEHQGYTVLTARSGQAAIALSRAYTAKLDLLLSEEVLIGPVDGCKLAATLRAAQPKMTILLMSSLLNRSPVQHAIAHEVLSKPFTMRDLLNAISRHQRNSLSAQIP